MKDGFIKVAAGTPNVQVADCEFNAAEIIKMVREMEAEGARVMVFPELCITAYTCGDLFWQENLLEEAKVQLMRIAEDVQVLLLQPGWCCDPFLLSLLSLLSLLQTHGSGCLPQLLLLYNHS